MNGKPTPLRYRGKDPLSRRLALLYTRRSEIDEIIRCLERYRRKSKLEPAFGKWAAGERP